MTERGRGGGRGGSLLYLWLVSPLFLASPCCQGLKDPVLERCSVEWWSTVFR